MKNQDDLFHWMWYTFLCVGEMDKERCNCPDKTLQSFFNEFVDSHQHLKQNKDKFQLINQGLIMLGAYAILVFPKEYFSKELVDQFEKDGSPPKIEHFKKEIDCDNAMSDRAKFLKKIRHAIAHANVEFNYELRTDDSTSMRLWNKNPYKGYKVDFQVTISVRDVFDFLNEVAHQFSRFL